MAASDLSPDARSQRGLVMSALSLSGTPRALEERQRPGSRSRGWGPAEWPGERAGKR